MIDLMNFTMHTKDLKIAKCRFEKYTMRKINRKELLLS